MSDQARTTTSTTRGRLSRASNTSRIPQPKGSQIPTPRRTSRVRAELEATPPKSFIPTPRRFSRPVEKTTDQARRLSRTPVKSPAGRLSMSRATPTKAPSTPTSLRAPRRASQTPTATTEKTPRSRPAVSYRRISSTQVDSQKSTTPKYRSRLSSASGIEKTRALPDRTTPSLLPSPAARRTSAVGGPSQRPVLQASPYARRSSTAGVSARTPGGGAAGRTAGAGPTGRSSGFGASGRVSSGGVTGRSSGVGSATRRGSGAGAPVRRASGPAYGKPTTGVTRKLNMAPSEEGEEHPAKRRLSGSSAGGRRASGARESGIQVRYDRIEKETAVVASPRRESGGRRVGGPNALESFRAVRRASMESSEGTEKETVAPMQIDMHPVEATGDKDEEEAEVKDVPEPTQESAEKPMEIDMSLRASHALPDRADPISTSDKLAFLRTPTRSRRTSERFADVDINLDNVERLRKSLGRRRSKGPNEDITKIATPKLRRFSSYARPSNPDDSNRENASGPEATNAHGISERMMVDGQAAGSDQTREPLRSIELNRGSDVIMDVAEAAVEKREKETSKPKGSPLPQLDGGDAWASEDVEDLGPF